MGMQGMEYLKKKLSSRRSRVNMRYEHYSMKNREYEIGFTIPKKIRDQYKAVLGWSAKTVDSLADRLIFQIGRAHV